MGFIERTKASLNDLASHSVVGRYFHLEGSGHRNEIKGARLTTEIRAGLTTFFTMAYIIAVNVCLQAPYS
jgi:AGZA family xanthine/uracil permease-like MFS transporter